MLFVMFSMISVVTFVSSAHLRARFLTSFATTENPLPASPALAASTEALRDKMFVWNAISSIVLMTLLICLDVISISF